MPAKYKSGHDHMRARDGRVEEEKKARAERWEAHAGWKDVKGLVRRAGEVGPKPVLLRSFDKKAVIEMRGGAQWHGWLHPKIVQSWGRVAGGFAPVVEFKADEVGRPYNFGGWKPLPERLPLHVRIHLRACYVAMKRPHLG